VGRERDVALVRDAVGNRLDVRVQAEDFVDD
jgi:hypothetical protein